MRHLYIDTNVVLDLALKRIPFLEEAETLFLLKDERKIEIYISALTLADAAYIAKKHGLNPFAIARKFLDWVRIVDLQKECFDQVLISKFEDFEDGLQYFSAASIGGIDAIITRNQKDFKSSLIPVYSPSEYLNLEAN